MVGPGRATGSSTRTMSDLQRLSRTALGGHARLFIHPAYARLVNGEPLIKRIIPLLIILFVVALGLMRGVALVQARGEAEENAELRISLLAKAVARDMMDASAPASLAAPTEALQGQLENALPPRATGKGRTILVMDPQGYILAVAPSRPELIGDHLDSVLGSAQPLTTLGEQAGVLPLTLESGEDVIATVYRGINSPGSVAVIQPVQGVLEDWRRTVSYEATVFVATSIVLVILGFAFHAQAARAQEADSIYAETQARFHTALRRGHSGLWEWDLSRGAIFWSPSMFEILGLPPQNRLLSVGEVADLIHPEDTNLIELANALVEAGGGQMDQEFRMRHLDGGWIWIRARAEVVSGPDDEPHLVGIAVDVTEHKRLAEASRTADLRLRDAIEAISEAFVLWDSANRLVLCNSKYQQLYNLPDALVRPGTSFSEIARHGRRPVISDGTPSQAGASVGARSLEARVDDGRWLQINERRTDDGGFVSVGTDITALKEHQARLLENEQALTATVADLRKSRQQLEKQAQQLVELAENYALEKDRAEDASRIKSEFLANVSHELRTPLNAIIGFSEMMLSGAFGPLGDHRYDEYCSDIRESGAFLLRIISDILDMARLDAGQIEIDREPLNLDVLIYETIQSYSDEAERAGIEVLTDIVPGLALSADGGAVRQILSNLVSNAVKFTPQGGLIRIRTMRASDGVAIIVEDTGIGIPQNAVAKLGRPFEQVQSPLTRSHRGSGLGLAISRSLVRLHGGEIDIVSSPGVGTKVTVVFPTAPETAGDAAAA